MIVNAWRGGLSISESANPLGISCTTVSSVYREWWQLCGQNWLVTESGQRRMARLGQTDNKLTVTKITTLRHCYAEEHL